ncbi:MAG: hypothetical protein AAB568_03790 [Patescibacteria group bacterium]
MFNSELKKQIRTLKEFREVHEPRPEWLKTNREILLMQIKNTTVQKEEAARFNLSFVWNSLDIFLPRQVVYYAVRPMAVIVLVSGLIFGSWVTTVSASYNSLPGDVLYSVKLATENVQTSLASKFKATKLRTEFAARRVEDVKKIVESNLPGKEKKVEEAVKNLKENLDQVKGNLEDLKKSTPKTDDVTGAQAAEVAKVVNDKTTEIQKSLEQAAGQLTAGAQVLATAPLQEQVKQATAAVAEAGVKAVEVMVEKHQEDSNSISSAEVRSAVDDKLKVLEQKVNVVDEKLNTLVSTSTVATNNSSRTEQARVETLVAPVKESSAAVKDVITQAKDELAKDNLGAALDMLKQVTTLTQAAENKTEATQILAAPQASQAGGQAAPPIAASTPVVNITSSTLPVIPSVLPPVTSTAPIK